MAEYAARLANSQDTIDRMRRVDALGLTPSGNPTLARSGLRPDGGGAVTVNSGQMSVSVTAFSAWIDGGASDAQVGYPVFLDAGKTLAIAAGHATLVRIDTVVAQVRDTAYDGSGSTDMRVYVVQGTPGAGAPALPQSAIPLRDISVHAGASSGTGGLTAANLSTDRRQYVTALGGTLPVASQAERDALTSLQNGSVVYRTDVDRLEVKTAAGWTPYEKVTRLTGAAVFSASTGSLTEARATIAGGMCSVHIQMSGVTWGSGEINVALGTFTAACRPAFYFGPIHGWPAGVSGLVDASTGVAALRYAPVGKTSSTPVLTGTWPVA